MEITIPEKVLFETNVYTVENDLKARRGKVRITEDRILFESVEELKIAPISAIRTIRIKRDEKLGFLIAGTIFGFASLILFSFLPHIDSFLSAVLFFYLTNSDANDFDAADLLVETHEIFSSLTSHGVWKRS
ncbi:MAG: hypothetical protein QXD49_02280 [Archaeoglobaceae archaeon]